MHSYNMYGSLAYLNCVRRVVWDMTHSFNFFNGLYSLSNAVNFPEWKNCLNPRVLHRVRLLSRKFHNFILRHSLAFIEILNATTQHAEDLTLQQMRQHMISNPCIKVKKRLTCIPALT